MRLSIALLESVFQSQLLCKKLPATCEILTSLLSEYLFAVSFLQTDESNLHSRMQIIGDYLNIMFRMFIRRSCGRLSLRQLQCLCKK